MNDSATLTRHRREFARAIANHRYEISPAGIHFPEQKVLVAGVFETTVNGRDRQVDPNVIPTQGLNLILDTIAGGAAQVNPWYVALFSGNVTPGLTLTGQTFGATCTEFVGYSEATRVAYVEAAAVAGVMDNGATRAVFTITAPATIHGGALLSASAKGANGAGDKCLAAARFSASRDVVAADELAVKYTLTVTSS